MHAQLLGPFATLHRSPTLPSSRSRSEFDFHNFRASSVAEFDPVAHVRGQQRLAERGNPTDASRSKLSSSTPTMVNVSVAPFLSFTVTIVPNVTLLDGASGGTLVRR
jgi:hypothetical protein